MKQTDITRQADDLQGKYRHLSTALGMAMSHATEARWKHQRRHWEFWNRVVEELRSRAPTS